MSMETTDSPIEGGVLPEGVRPDQVRAFARANFLIPGTLVKGCSYVVIESNDRSATLFVATRNKGWPIITVSAVVLARVSVTRRRFEILARSRPLLRNHATDENWREALEIACRLIGVDPSYLDRLESSGPKCKKGGNGANKKAGDDAADAEPRIDDAPKDEIGAHANGAEPQAPRLTRSELGRRSSMSSTWRNRRVGSLPPYPVRNR
jgi:hypothetical protein